MALKAAFGGPRPDPALQGPSLGLWKATMLAQSSCLRRLLHLLTVAVIVPEEDSAGRKDVLINRPLNVTQSNSFGKFVNRVPE